MQLAAVQFVYPCLLLIYFVLGVSEMFHKCSWQPSRMCTPAFSSSDLGLAPQKCLTNAVGGGCICVPLSVPHLLWVRRLPGNPHRRLRQCVLHLHPGQGLLALLCNCHSSFHRRLTAPHLLYVLRPTAVHEPVLLSPRQGDFPPPSPRALTSSDHSVLRQSMNLCCFPCVKVTLPSPPSPHLLYVLCPTAIHEPVLLSSCPPPPPPPPSPGSPSSRGVSFQPVSIVTLRCASSLAR